MADVIKGLKLDLTGTLAPNSGSKAAKLGAEFKQDISVTRATLDLLDGPTVAADSVFRFNDFIVGGDVTYGVAKESIQKFGAGIGYISPLFSASLMAYYIINLVETSLLPLLPDSIKKSTLILRLDAKLFTTKVLQT
jgi:hypothetical protein